MSVEDPRSPEVAAMLFDEAAVAADLAHWCDGTVVTVDDVVCIRVPVLAGNDLARRGDWIVRLAAEEFVVMDADEFAARMEPRPEDDPLA